MSAKAALAYRLSDTLILLQHAGKHQPSSLWASWDQPLQDASVRAMAVSRLLELFGGSPTAPPTSPDTTAQPPSHLPLLHDFITRFTSRFKELPDDINEEVAVLGVSQP